MEDLGQLIVAKDFKKLPKVQQIAQSGHTDWEPIPQTLRTEATSNLEVRVL